MAEGPNVAPLLDPPSKPTANYYGGGGPIVDSSSNDFDHLSDGIGNLANGIFMECFDTG
jgi:hypothetical protein